MIINTLAAMAAGYVLSMVFGTPRKFRAQDIVSRIAAALAPKISAKYQDNEGGRRTAGIVFLLSLIAVTVLPVLIVLILLYCFIPALALVLDALICWSVLDIKGVTTASTGVARAMRGKNYAKAQRIASDLSRTDCSELDEKGLVRAAVQGVADRTVDSAAAPMLCMFLLSAAGGVFFTAADCAAEIADESEDFTRRKAAPRALLYTRQIRLPHDAGRRPLPQAEHSRRRARYEKRYKMRTLMLRGLPRGNGGHNGYLAAARRGLQRAVPAHIHHRRTA